MQTQFDFDRADQLGMIKEWRPPKRKGLGGAACKNVLRVIDSYGRGKSAWPSEQTIARDSGLSLSTVKRAIKSLVELSVIITERKGSLTINHYTIVWSELALLCRDERSDTVNERSVMVNERSVMVNERSVMVTPELKENKSQETTTTAADAVVVELGKILGQAPKAVRLARSRGVSDEQILERIQRWRELPDDARRPGTLYNWLAIEGSYRPPKEEPKYGRGDGFSRDQVVAEALRLRIVRAGRAAGASQEAIERRLQEVGV